MPDLRLAVPAVALWATCALLIGLPEASWPVVIVSACAAVACVGFAAVRRSRTRALPVSAVALGAIAIGAAIVAVQAPSRESEELAAAAGSSASVDLVVAVDRPPHRLSGGFGDDPRWTLRGRTAGERPGVPVSVQFDATEAEARTIALGAVVRVSGAVVREDPGDATTFLIRAARDRLMVEERPPPWLAWAAEPRAGFAQAATVLPGDGGTLLPGLAIGDETAVTPSLDAAMKASSLSHLTAVSGANCALVIGLVFLAARLVGLPRRARVVVAGAALLGFVVLVGPGASVIRAAAMATVMLVGLARGRPADGVPALALAVIALLVHDPWLARDYGFALSVLATAGLLILAAPLARALSRWMPASLALALAVPTAAQLACQPVLILLAPSLPLYGVPANLLAEPAAPVATVLGCVACAVLPWAPWLGEVLVRLAWVPSAWIAQVATFASGLPAAALPWAPGAVGVVLCALTLVAVAVLVSARRSPPAAAAVAAGVLVIGAVVYGGVLAGGYIARVAAIPHDWMVAACDVGQGDALLVRDGDAVAMIDAGRRPEPASACLERLGIGRLRLLVLTHFDADHVGGLSGVVSRAETALVQRAVRDADHRTLGLLRDAGVPAEQAHAGLEGQLGRLRWRLLWPPEPTPAGMPDDDVGNCGSLTLEVEGRGVRALFLGDLDETAQDALLATRTVHRVDVVKVGHHGSADQSPALYAALSAQVGLVSVGERNGYGHPTRSALRMLSQAGTAVARTDQQGLLLVSPGEHGVSVWSERPAATSVGGRPYPGYGRGGTWRPEATAEAERARRAPPPARSRRFRGTRCGPLPWSSSPGRRGSSPTARSAPCATRSRPTIRASRSATCTRETTRRASCSPSRAPPCSASRGSSGSRRWRSATRRSSPTCSTTSKPPPTGRW
ncbi:MBL fold metallo-hydrolase [Leifsonia sp. C5G2]|nr:MBL fold metallo-hydrolase [Leifsonia sp. C5G2]